MDKPLIIFDTDMDTDCDDAGALGLLLGFVKKEKAELLGIIADTPVEYAAAACEAICNWYGVKAPIGAVSAETYKNDERFIEYRKQRSSISAEKYYNEILAKRVGKTDADYTPAAALYRKLFVGAPDNSVTVVCVGLLTAVAELFSTTGDEISPLSGIELFNKKVKYVVSMGNARYPEMTDKNFNYKMDRVATKTFFEKCPVPVYICPKGTRVITGFSFTEKFPKEHPLRLAYEMFMSGENIGRSSWDLITLLFALGYHSSVFTTESHGIVRYEETNRIYWEENGNREDFQVNTTVSDDEIAVLLEDLLTKK